MADHLLTRVELYQLFNLNFNMSSYRQSFRYKENYSSLGKPGEWSDEYIDFIKNLFHVELFDNLLKKQPELTAIVDNFWKESKTTKYIESLACNTFENKILLKNIYPLIFNAHYFYIGKEDRKNFVKKMIQYEPWIMNHLHEKLKKNKDDALLLAYVELLPRHINEIKDSKESILENISTIDSFSESHITKAMNSLVKSMEHDKILYDFLKKIILPKFETFHSLRENFNKIENKYFSQFKEKKISIFNNEQQYIYVFCIKDSVMVDYFGINKNISVGLQHQIHDCIKEYWVFGISG